MTVHVVKIHDFGGSVFGKNCGRKMWCTLGELSKYNFPLLDLSGDFSGTRANYM
jgi:hypothetical protein